MGDLSQNAVAATIAGAVVIALVDVRNTHTVLVGTALPFVFFSVVHGCGPSTVWGVDAGFVLGLVLTGPYLAFLLSVVVFFVIQINL